MSGARAVIWLRRFSLGPWPIQDGTVVCIEALCTTYSRFCLDAETKANLGKIACIQWVIKDGAHEVSASMKEPAPPCQFTTQLVRFDRFYAHLANANHHEVAVECHECKLTFTKDYLGEVTGSKSTSSPTKTCVFICMPVPASYTENHACRQPSSGFTEQCYGLKFQH